MHIGVSIEPFWSIVTLRCKTICALKIKKSFPEVVAAYMYMSGNRNEIHMKKYYTRLVKIFKILSGILFVPSLPYLATLRF